jgi:diguanylate cyclase (GGDEF)-like protein
MIVAILLPVALTFAIGFVIEFRQNGALRRLIGQMSEKADRDELTGLWRREAWERWAVAARDNNPNRHVVCFIDVDHFKRLNTELTHLGANVVLAELADRLRAMFGDNAARAGGDEFALLHCTALDLKYVREMVAAAMGVPVSVPEPYPGATRIVPVSATVGCAAWEPGQDLSAALRAADVDLLRQKADRDAASGWRGLARQLGPGWLRRPLPPRARALTPPPVGASVDRPAPLAEGRHPARRAPSGGGPHSSSVRRRYVRHDTS